jgi:hypothetical protein
MFTEATAWVSCARAGAVEGVLGDGFAEQDREQGPGVEGQSQGSRRRISNNPGLAVDGKLEQGMGHIRQAGEKMKDAGWSLFRR